MVAEQVDGEHRDEDGQPGKGRQPPCRAQIEAPAVQHSPPGDHPRLHAESQEGERRLQDDHVGHGEDGHDDDGGEDIREHVPDHDPHVAGARGPRGLHEVAALDGQGLAPRQARVERPARHAERENDVPEPRPEHGHHRDGEQDGGHGELDVGDAHQHVVRPAAGVSGDQTDEHAHRARDAHRDHAHQERDARAEDEPAQDVAPDLVGAEQVREPGSLEALGDVLLVRAIRRQRLGERGRDHDDADGRRGQPEGEPALPHAASERRRGSSAA